MLQVDNGETVTAFLTEWYCKKKSFAGCKMAKYAIAAYLVDHGLENVTKSLKIEKLMKGVERFSKVPIFKDRDPFPVSLLSKLVQEKPNNWSHFKWLQTCVLISVGLRTMARASELLRLEKRSLQIEGDKLIVTFDRTKTRKQGRSVTIHKSNRLCDPVILTDAWLREYEVKGKLFENMNSRDISARLQEISNYFQVNCHLSSHSLRIGGASALAMAGYTKEQIQAIGDWSSNAIDRYMKTIVDVVTNISHDMFL